MSLAFRGILEAGSGGGAAVEVPEDVVASLGTPAKRPPVRVTVNGYEYPTRIAVYGGKSYVGVHKATRSALRITPGDTIDVTIALAE
jgi:hypothetical protein